MNLERIDQVLFNRSPNFKGRESTNADSRLCGGRNQTLVNNKGYKSYNSNTKNTSQKDLRNRQRQQQNKNLEFRKKLERVFSAGRAKRKQNGISAGRSQDRKRRYEGRSEQNRRIQNDTRRLSKMQYGYKASSDLYSKFNKRSGSFTPSSGLNSITYNYMKTSSGNTNLQKINHHLSNFVQYPQGRTGYNKKMTTAQTHNQLNSFLSTNPIGTHDVANNNTQYRLGLTQAEQLKSHQRNLLKAQLLHQINTKNSKLKLEGEIDRLFLHQHNAQFKDFQNSQKLHQKATLSQKRQLAHDQQKELHQKEQQHLRSLQVEAEYDQVLKNKMIQDYRAKMDGEKKRKVAEVGYCRGNEEGRRKVMQERQRVTQEQWNEMKQVDSHIKMLKKERKEFKINKMKAKKKLAEMRRKDMKVQSKEKKACIDRQTEIANPVNSIDNYILGKVQRTHPNPEVQNQIDKKQKITLARFLQQQIKNQESAQMVEVDIDIKQAKLFQEDTKRYNQENWNNFKTQKQKEIQNAKAVKHQIEHGI
ncbi:unnamed protein product [Moneuplotes crassus]|uniref:Uncharacterized protein n=1 Tax=Euplotes crassus TaxID=5936 RepID=A0AAD1U9C1_EUPCR|nr:unnamed protein product [Moneuplotes crassus]